MQGLEVPTLVGRHVRLEPLAREHADALLLAGNESRSTFGFTIVPDTKAAMAAFMDTAFSQFYGESMPFVARDAHGVIVGTTRFMFIERWRWHGPPAARFVGPGIDPPTVGAPDALEVGATWYAERVQRTALNTEAKLLLCTHAFERWGVRRVTWKTDERNARSRAAIARLGAKLDGVLRAHWPGATDGKVRNTAFYSMLAEEWPAARLALEARLVARAM